MFSELATQSLLVKTLSIVLPAFYNKTKLSVQIYFQYDVQQQGMVFSLGFSPRDATEKEYELLFSQIQNAEKLIVNDYVINESLKFEDLKSFVVSHKENTKELLKNVKK